MIHARRLRELPLHLMLLPAVIITLIYSYFPMLGIVIAFQDFEAPTPFSSPWVGLDNFKAILEQPDFFNILWNTLYMATMKIIGNIIVPLIFSLLLNEVGYMAVKKSVQTIIYLPNFISWVILAGIFIDVLSPSDGIINKILGLVGIEPIYFLGDPVWFPNTMIITDVWKNFGFGTVIFLAALTSIDPELYESAIVDGAGRWKQTLHITLPGIKPIVILVSVLSLGGILNAGFEQIINMYNPQVYSSGDILDTLLYRIGLLEAQYSKATAVGLFRSIVSLILIATSYKLADKLANYRIF